MDIFISRKLSKYLFCIGICFLVTSLAFALGDENRNALLIGVMAISPLVFVLIPVINRKTDVGIFLFMTLTLFCPLLNHPETMRWSTALYGCMFGFYFMALFHLFGFSDLSKQDIDRLLKFLLLAYAIVLLIQQICVLTGFPIFNLGNYDLREPWKLNSLMSEPEHSGRMTSLLMYAYLSITSNEKTEISFVSSWRKDKLVWIAFLWCMLTSLSAGAYLFMLVVLSKFYTKGASFKIVGAIVTLYIMLSLFDISAFNRFTKFCVAIFTFDIHKIYSADQSAALRIVPSLICLQQIDLFTVDGWFGRGIDYMSRIMSDYLPGVEKGYTGGGLLLYAVEYGFLSFLVIIRITFKLCYDRNNKTPSILFWFFSVFLVGVNSQLTWATIVLLYMVKCIQKLEKSI